MLPRSVHGQGERHGFIPQLIAIAQAKGVSGYLGTGASRWPAVHVKDAATLYRLAVEQAPAASVLNAVGDEGVPVREIAAAIGRHLNLPSRSLSVFRTERRRKLAPALRRVTSHPRRLHRRPRWL
jgi:nucleoside-diphosphate-sugar epimerase